MNSYGWYHYDLMGILLGFNSSLANKISKLEPTLLLLGIFISAFQLVSATYL